MPCSVPALNTGAPVERDLWVIGKDVGTERLIQVSLNWSTR
jgi:hypothetical protein